MFRVFTENLELSQTQYHLEYDDHHIAFLTKEQYESFLKIQERIKELEAKLKEFGNHKSNCTYIQGLRGQSIEKCDCGFVQALKG